MGKPFRLEPAHLAGTGCFPVRAFPADDNSHGRVLGKSVGIIGVVVSCQAAVYGLFQQGDELVADVFAGSTLLEVFIGGVGQAKGVVEFSACEQSCV